MQRITSTAAESHRAPGTHHSAFLVEFGSFVPSLFARTRERFLLAQSLEQSGRLDEAYERYAATPHGSRLDYVYLAPSHLARGRIKATQGDGAAAARHFRQVIELLAGSDPELRGMLAEARNGLASLGA